MGQILIPGGGGGTGVYSGDLTATKGDVLKGKSYVGSDTGDEAGIGTLELTGNAGIGDVLAGKGFYATDPKTKLTGALALTGNITAQRVLSGYTGYATDPKIKITGAIPSYSGRTITPGTSNQTIAAGNYLSGNVVIAGDGDLVAANIKNGKNIFNVQGTCKEYKVWVGNASTVGTKRCTDYNDGRAYNLYYIQVNPGFTPTYAFCQRVGDGEYICMSTPWSRYLVEDNERSKICDTDRAANGLSFTSSNVQLVSFASGEHNVWILGYV